MDKHLPLNVKIGGITFPITWCDDLIVSRDTGEVRTGEIVYDDCTIKIMKTDNYEKNLQVLLHEIVHGLCEEYKIDFGENKEKYTDMLAFGFLQVLVDNVDFELKG
jgi:hypothetical protein